MARRDSRCPRPGERLSLEGRALALSIAHCPRDNRDALVGPTLLRTDGQQGASREGRSGQKRKEARRCVSNRTGAQMKASREPAAPSIPANPPKRVWSKTST